MNNNEKTIAQEAIDAIDEVLSGQGKLRVVRPVLDLKELRKKLNLTQAQFAKRYHFNLSTLRNWEQGMRTPDIATIAYLTCIERMPQQIAEALN